MNGLTPWQTRLYGFTLDTMILCRRLQRHRQRYQQVYDFLAGFGLAAGLLGLTWLLWEQ